jgi:hypothetical protein
MANDIFPGASLGPACGFIPRSGVPAGLAVSVVHTTAGLSNAAAQVTYSARVGSQVTATFWVNRDGSVVQSLPDPLRQGPWTNGILNRPDLTNPRIAAMVRDGANPNTRSLITIENVSLEPGAPITTAQQQTCAALVKYYHAKAGVPINRETVVGHYQIDSVNRPNCPSTNKAIINEIVGIATGATPTTGVDDVLNQMQYPWPRAVYTKGGNVEGYKYSDEPNKTFSFGAGSPTTSAGEVAISPTPAEWLDGPYQWINAGPMAGYMVANSQLTMDPKPVPLTAPPSPAPALDCSREIAGAVAPLQTTIDKQTATIAAMERKAGAHSAKVIQSEKDFLNDPS